MNTLVGQFINNFKAWMQSSAHWNYAITQNNIEVEIHAVPFEFGAYPFELHHLFDLQKQQVNSQEEVCNDQY